jgi:hypothetical protein
VARSAFGALTIGPPEPSPVPAYDPAMANPVRARSSLLLAAGLLAAGLAACSQGTATPGPSGTAGTPVPTPGPTGTATPAPDPIEVYRSIASDVIAIRGLEPATSIDPKIIDPATLQANITAEFDKSNPAGQIRITERVYQALGLFPTNASLRDVYLALQGSQVIGYYDPTVDELFIVSRSGSLGPTERVTYAHEFTHQLQDGRFDLESLGLDTHPDEGDRNLAVLGLVEGDAVSVQTRWMTSHLSPADLTEIAAEAADPALLQVMADTPAILLETSLFPYTAGAAFVNQRLADGGYAAVNAVFGELPESTEQLIHPEKYADHEHPIAVSLPADLATRFGGAAGLDAQDTLGELQLRVWLKELGVAGDVARVAAAGWGGDRVGLLHTQAGDVLVLSTAWDSLADAAEFKDAAAVALDHLPGKGSMFGTGTRVAILIGPDGLDAQAIDPILRSVAGN